MPREEEAGVEGLREAAFLPVKLLANVPSKCLSFFFFPFLIIFVPCATPAVRDPAKLKKPFRVPLNGFFDQQEFPW